MSDETKRSQESAWGKYMRTKHEATVNRNADPIRAARAAAYLAARRELGCTDERAIEAANAAEVEVRTQLGITEPLDTSVPAADWPCFPSDIRSMAHNHLNV